MPRLATSVRAILMTIAALAVASTAQRAGAQTAVTSCGQVVVGDGIMTSDLDCSAHPGPSAVVLSTAGELALGAFTLRGPLTGEAVRCEDDCIVTAATPTDGGIVLDNGATGVDAVAAASSQVAVTLSLVRIDGFAVGVRAHTSKLSDVEIVNTTTALTSVSASSWPGRILIRNSLFRGGSRILALGNLERGSMRVLESVFEDNTDAQLFHAPSYRATIKGSRLVGNYELGQLGAVKLIDTDILDTAYRGFTGANKIGVRGGEISGNAVASGVPGWSVVLSANFVKVRDVVMNGNLTAIAGDSIRVRDTTIAGSVVDGVSGRIVRVTNSSIVGSGRYGVRARGEQEFLGQDRKGKLELSRSTVTGSGTFGVLVDGEWLLAGDDDSPDCALPVATAKISQSIVTGNGTDAECGATLACADVAACDPTLVTSADACDTSYQVESGMPGSTLGVCALD